MDDQQLSALRKVVATSIASVQIPGGMRHDEYCGYDGLRMVSDAAISGMTAAGYDIIRSGDDEANDAVLGRSIVTAIGTHAVDPSSPLFEWSPAERWDEVIGDLVEMVNEARNAARPMQADRSTPRRFTLGDRVTKVHGSSWTGRVVGFYSTALTPVGYAVESENEPGSVQIYPESALRRLG